MKIISKVSGFLQSKVLISLRASMVGAKVALRRREH